MFGQRLKDPLPFAGEVWGFCPALTKFLSEKPQQLYPVFRTHVAFICDVVGSSGEVVDGLNGGPEVGRAKPRGDGEVFVMFHPVILTCFFHNARPRSQFFDFPLGFEPMNGSQKSMERAPRVTSICLPVQSPKKAPAINSLRIVS